jgi:hypothetical protein
VRTGMLSTAPSTSELGDTDPCPARQVAGTRRVLPNQALQRTSLRAAAERHGVRQTADQIWNLFGPP